MKYKSIKRRLSILLAIMLVAQSGTALAAYQGEDNALVQENQDYAHKEYTMMDLYRMDESTLVETLSHIKWNQVTDVFQMNEGAKRFYGSEKHLNALINALVEKGQLYTAEDNLGIPTLIEVLRAGYYLGYYNQEMNFMKSESALNKVEPAMQSIVSNPHFGFGSREQEEVMSTLGLLINNTKLFDGIVEKVTPAVEDYAKNYSSYIGDRSKNKAMYDIIHAIDYMINNQVYRQRLEPDKSIYKNKMDAYIEALNDIALNQELREGEESCIYLNAAYQLGYLGKFHSNPKIGQSTITQILDKAEPSTELQLQMAERLKSEYKGENSRGEKIDHGAMLAAAKEKYLSEKYVFDNGRIIITTGNRVSKEKVQRLYWAAKEVEAQFFRAFGRDQALEAGNPDDVLNIVIYNSPAEYKMNRLINGISTDNGGMYIEGDGVFYTYERTPQESIYTLEELFRHEFTHYLQGRYVAPGLWGRSDIYKNDRLTWYEEGGAEFFAGSTRTEGVLPRQSMVRSIKGYEDRWYSANKTLHSKYGSFEFYTYAYALTDLLYDDKAAFDRFAEVIKNGDVAGYDALIKEFSQNESFNRQYQERMQMLSEQYEQLTIPLVSDHYMIHHERESLENIMGNVQRYFRMTNIKAVGSQSDFFNTLSLEGDYAGKLSAGKDSWHGMNDYLNEQLEALANESWTGYKTFTAYYKDAQVDGQGNIRAKIVIRGVYTDDMNKIEQIPQMEYKPKPKPGQDTVTKDDAENVKLPADMDARFMDASGKLEEGKIENFDYLGGRKVYYFESEQEKEIRIALKNLPQGSTVAVLEDNNSEYLAYQRVSSAHTDLKFQGKKQRYYLVVWGGEAAENKAEVVVYGIAAPKEEPKEEPKPTTEDNQRVDGKIDERFSDVLGKLYQNEALEKNYEGGRMVYCFDAVKEGKTQLKFNTDLEDLVVAVVKEGQENYTAYEKISNQSDLTMALNKGRYYVILWSGAGNQSGKVSVKAEGNVESKSQKPSEKPLEKELGYSFDAPIVVEAKTNLQGLLSGNDSSRYYQFEISEATSKTIDLKAIKGEGLNWLLYRAEDLEKYFAYANKQGDALVNTVNLEPGKYYLVVYKFAEEDISYALNIQ